MIDAALTTDPAPRPRPRADRVPTKPVATKSAATKSAPAKSVPAKPVAAKTGSEPPVSPPISSTPTSSTPTLSGDSVANALLSLSLVRSLDAIVLIDDAGRVRFWNEAATRAFGYAPIEALGCPVHELIVPPEHHARHVVGFEEAAATGIGAILDHRLEIDALHKNGHSVPIELTIAALPSGGYGADARFWFVCSMRDLTERRATEAALRRTETRFRQLVETVPGMVYEFALYPDGTMGFEHVSAGCRGIMGYEPEDFLVAGLRIESLILCEDRAGFLASILASARDLRPWDWEGRTRIPTGEIRWIRGQSRPVRRADDGATVWYGVVTDVTEQHGAQSKLEASNAELEARVELRTRELRATQKEILARLGRAAAYRDDDTGQHIERMSRTCAILAAEMGLSPEECGLLLAAAPMHDIGKIAIPDDILHKPGRLDETELATMRTHAEIGAQMLAGADSELVRMAETIARTHHERWDGTGYPHRLAGEEIPLVGRIAAVADVFDALTSERPYKRAWPVAEAVAEIERASGTHFDPAVVAAFVRALPLVKGSSRPPQRPAPPIRLAA